jgi:hypothetical protein
MTTKDEAIRILREALETCRTMADSNNDGISFRAADKALADTATITPSPAQAQASGGEVAGDTGNAEADRLINRLMSSDPDFDDCADAAAFIRRAALATRTAGSATPVAPQFKDHNIRQLVNDLRDIALKFHDTQQLRARISSAVGQFLATQPAVAEGVDTELPKPECLVVGVYGYREKHMLAYGAQQREAGRRESQGELCEALRENMKLHRQLMNTLRATQPAEGLTDKLPSPTIIALPKPHMMLAHFEGGVEYPVFNRNHMHDFARDYARAILAQQAKKGGAQ